ncbi:MAG TPA: hypothetical protein VFV54_08145, partial [Thermoanaerobaculia bacterium]|nr:hypothetical protein [Thermoanaerobaculia bacterium]
MERLAGFEEIGARLTAFAGFAAARFAATRFAAARLAADAFAAVGLVRFGARDGAAAFFRRGLPAAVRAPAARLARRPAFAPRPERACLLAGVRFCPLLFVLFLAIAASFLRPLRDGQPRVASWLTK